MEDKSPAKDGAGPATEANLYELVGRAVADAGFRGRMFADPEAATAEAGYILTQAQRAALQRAEGDGLAGLLEERLAGMGVSTRAARPRRTAVGQVPGSPTRPVPSPGREMLAGRARVGLVFAPVSGCNRTVLGISLLKGVLANQDIGCEIHYFHLALAAAIGLRLCDLIALHVRPELLLGEWLFAPALFGPDANSDVAYVQQVMWGGYRESFTPAIVYGLLRIRDRLPSFLDTCVDRVDWAQYDLVGFSTSFQQNCASLALAQRIRARYPDVPIALGGANCAGEMGAAMFRQFPFIDYVCTGYGEIGLPTLVGAITSGKPVPSIPGILARNAGSGIARAAGADVDLDALPYPDYSDYQEQLQQANPPVDYELHVNMESSRGCWWADKSRCTFCGQNDTELTYRHKSPDRFLAELRHLCDRYGNKVDIMDNLMPRAYLKTVLPRLAAEPGIVTGWEVRASLTREQVSLFARAGAEWIQPGIETLSDPILRLIRKGVTVLDSIQVLKWAKQFGVRVVWNVLWGFPGEDPAEYAAMAELVPLLAHLDPPYRHGRVRLDRWSAYWSAPEAYGITRLEPLSSYRYVYQGLPDEGLRDLAYYFCAEYPDESAVYTEPMTRVLNEWQACKGAALDVFPSADGIRIADTRRPGQGRAYHFDGPAAGLYLLCDAAQSLTALMKAAGISERMAEPEVVALLEQFVQEGLMMRSGKRYLSLAIAREPSDGQM